jgi:hypothetical protein
MPSNWLSGIIKTGKLELSEKSPREATSMNTAMETPVTAPIVIWRRRRSPRFVSTAAVKWTRLIREVIR